MDEVDITDAPVDNTTTEQPDVANQNEGKPEGWDQVEFTSEQQARFNRMYGQVKGLERGLSERDSLLKQQSDLINELRQGQHQIVSHIQNDDFSRAEANVVQQQRDAYERGDLDGFNRATTQLSKMAAQRAIAEQQVKPQPQAQQSQPVSGMDVVNQAVQSGDITYADADAFRAWANEIDTYGNLKRPWVNVSDIRGTAAAIEGSAVFNNPAFINKPFAAKLAEIDKRMGLANQQAGQAVMPSGVNLTRNPKPSNIKLSPFQEKIAVRTKFAGSGKSNAEHLEAYRKQVAEVKGARK